MRKEIWKIIPGYDGKYEVSNFGRIRSMQRLAPRGNSHYLVKDKILKPQKGGGGYATVFLSSGGVVRQKFIHRVVAEIFVTGRFPGAQVNHKNGIKMDAAADNLEWVTAKQNARHSFDVLGHRCAFGESHGKVKLTTREVMEIKAARATGEKALALSRKYKVSKPTIFDIWFKRSWKHLE